MVTDAQTRTRQKQKSADMRSTICEATIECLSELGYAETSINRVIEQAGVSKGALQHHFPSKEDLMADTAQFLLERPLRLTTTPAAGETSRDIRRELVGVWKKMMNTPAYSALLEILIAARTDALLQNRIAPGLDASIQHIDSHFADKYGELNPTEAQELKLLMCANRCFMRGLLIEEQYGFSKSERLAVLDRWLDLIVPPLAELDQRTEMGAIR